MLWLKRFHDDHMALVGILPKLEGNLRDIEAGEAGENVIWELREFADLIKDVVIPHFKEEEKSVYPEASGVDEDGRKFIAGMYDEHEKLYDAFEGFFKSLEGYTYERGHNPAHIMAVSENANKLEVPKHLDKMLQMNYLEGKIEKDSVLKHGYKIVQLLKEHIEKEETAVAELIRRAKKLGPD